jgi:hypothetical protein
VYGNVYCVRIWASGATEQLQQDKRKLPEGRMLQKKYVNDRCCMPGVVIAEGLLIDHLGEPDACNRVTAL